MRFIVLNCQVVECVDIFANPVFKNPGINYKYHKKLSANRLRQFFKLFNFDNIIRRRISDHNITFAIKYLLKSHLGC